MYGPHRTTIFNFFGAFFFFPSHECVRPFSVANGIQLSPKTGKLTLNFSFSFFSIREVADKINKYGTQSFPTLSALKVPAKQVVVGNSYLGVLLADGRAFRVAYSVIAERLDLSKHDASSKR